MLSCLLAPCMSSPFKAMAVCIVCELTEIKHKRLPGLSSMWHCPHHCGVVGETSKCAPPRPGLASSPPGPGPE